MNLSKGWSFVIVVGTVQVACSLAGLTWLSRRTEADISVLVTLGVLLAITLAALGFVVRRYERGRTEINRNLEEIVERRSQALMKTRDAVIFGMAKLAESRDTDTGEHLERIYAYVWVLVDQMSPGNDDLDARTAAMMALTSSLHDVGKVAIPDAILLKPGKLTEEEREVIKKHPLCGGDTLFAIKQRLGSDDFLTLACEIAFAHHERWDGKGYPFGLKRDDIPLSGRIVALADVYDALTTKRVYKDAMTHEQARHIIVEGSGTHFDPDVVDAFLAREDEFRAIASGQSHLLAKDNRPLPPLTEI